jgi:hypothetical protein
MCSVIEERNKTSAFSSFNCHFAKEVVAVGLIREVSPSQIPRHNSL